MTERVSVSIAIGGCLAADLLDAFVDLAQSERLSTDWDGEPFAVADLPVEGPLRLHALEVRNGELDDVEAFCLANALPFRRASDGAAGAFDPEVVVWSGQGEPRRFPTNMDGHVVLDADTARALGSYDAVCRYFEDSTFQPPPFRTG